MAPGSLPPLAAPVGPGEATLAGALEGLDGPRRVREYPPTASSPLWAALAALALLVGTWIAAAWALVGAASETATWSESGARVWVVVLVGFASYVAWVLWLSLIGTNGGTYGVGLVLVVSFPWWAPLVYLGPVGAIVILAIQLTVLVWPWRLLVTGIWTAGGLPEGYAVLGWLPVFMGFALFSAPSEVAVLIGLLLISMSGLFNAGSILAVTMIQHLGIARDRRGAAAFVG